MKVQLRLTQLHAAPTLADLALLPQARFHELTGNRKGQSSVDLNGPYRLIFDLLDDPIPRKADGGLDLSRVRGVRILEIADPH
jgi:proteic killer suppression protein